MKKFWLLLMGSTLLLIGACKQVNQELVDNMETDLAAIKKNSPQLDTISLKITELTRRMEMAPGNLKMRPEYKFEELNSKILAMRVKCGNLTTMAREISIELDTLIQGYSNGSLKEEEVQTRYTPIAGALKGLPETLGAIQPVLEETAATFNKAMEEWQSLPESEREKNKAGFPMIRNQNEGAATNGLPKVKGN